MYLIFKASIEKYEMKNEREKIAFQEAKMISFFSLHSATFYFGRTQDTNRDYFLVKNRIKQVVKNGKRDQNYWTHTKRPQVNFAVISQAFPSISNFLIYIDVVLAVNFFLIYKYSKVH